MSLVQVCAVDPGAGAPCPPASLAYVDLSAIVTPADLGITPGGIAEAFGWGFAAVVFVWFLGYVIGVALTAIRKV